jgi:hypothetical protein
MFWKNEEKQLDVKGAVDAAYKQSGVLCHELAQG